MSHRLCFEHEQLASPCIGFIMLRVQQRDNVLTALTHRLTKEKTAVFVCLVCHPHLFWASVYTFRCNTWVCPSRGHTEGRSQQFCFVLFLRPPSAVIALFVSREGLSRRPISSSTFLSNSDSNEESLFTSLLEIHTEVQFIN